MLRQRLLFLSVANALRPPPRDASSLTANYHRSLACCPPARLVWIYLLTDAESGVLKAWAGVHRAIQQFSSGFSVSCDAWCHSGVTDPTSVFTPASMLTNLCRVFKTDGCCLYGPLTCQVLCTSVLPHSTYLSMERCCALWRSYL